MPTDLNKTYRTVSLNTGSVIHGLTRDLNFMVQEMPVCNWYGAHKQGFTPSRIMMDSIPTYRDLHG